MKRCLLLCILVFCIVATINAQDFNPLDFIFKQQLEYYLQILIVSNQDVGGLDELRDALDFLAWYYSTNDYFGEAIVVKLLPGTYESVDLSPLADLGITNFTLQGEGGSIVGGDYGVRLVTTPDTQCDGAVYNLIDLNISGSTRGIVFQDDWSGDTGDLYAPELSLNIINCTITECSADSYSGPQMSAAAVIFQGSGSIQQCTITNNTMGIQPPESPLVGGITVINNSTSPIEVLNNHFIDNTGHLCGGLIAMGKGLIRIVGNQFRSNTADGECVISAAYKAHALSVFQASNVIVQENIFVDNFDPGGSSIPGIGLLAIQSPNSLPIRFLNNTIINTPPNAECSLRALAFYTSTGQDAHIVNNVISTTNSIGGMIRADSGLMPDNFKYNVIHNTSLSGFSAYLYNPDDPNSVYNPTAPRFNYQCDPQLDAEYYPIWDSDTMSHCIDTGTGPWDADETPADIGAVRAIEHSYWDYEFDDQHDWQKWYWVSYPVLNTVTTGDLEADEFFEELLQMHQVLFNGNLVNVPVYLDEIKWFAEGSPYSIKWIELTGGWSMNLSNHSVSSPQGYKIKLKEDIDPAFSWPVHLVESGFKTPESTQFPIYANTENWLGYFKEDSASPQDAFASIWNDIEMVRGKNWSLERVNGLLTGKSGTINYGDMVIVRTYSNHTFQWESSIVTPPETKAVPKKFLFDEKPDYIPVYVSLPDSMMLDLKEIGLYVDGVCKGAVVVEDNLEQISAYVDSATELSDGTVEFVLFYESGKCQESELRSMNIGNGRMQAQYGDAGASYPFFEIQITPDDVDNIPPTDFSLRQNYPNPFNPTTTITYSLPEAARVQLDIYNLKGQLVKTLVIGDEPAGMRSVVWDGRDSNNAAVASGVYFYRVSTPQATQTKRMLLMK